VREKRERKREIERERERGERKTEEIIKTESER
jgi:hypothetical protein